MVGPYNAGARLRQKSFAFDLKGLTNERNDVFYHSSFTVQIRWNDASKSKVVKYLALTTNLFRPRREQSNL